MAKSKLPIKPIGGNILVRPVEEDTTTPSGLVISSTKSSERPQMGEIVALGTGRTDKDGNPLNWNVEVGQKVAFKKYSPDELEFDDQKYLIMREEDILGVIESN